MIDEVRKQRRIRPVYQPPRMTMAVTTQVTVVLGVVAGALTLVWMRWRNSRTRQLISKIPGPATNPVFGNVLQLPNSPEGMSCD